MVPNLETSIVSSKILHTNFELSDWANKIFRGHFFVLFVEIES